MGNDTLKEFHYVEATLNYLAEVPTEASSPQSSRMTGKTLAYYRASLIWAEE